MNNLNAKKMNTGRFLIGILAGAAAGALLGILFAPDKGSETRRRIMDKGDNYVRNLRNRFNDFKNSWNKEQSAAESEFREETLSPSI